MYKGIFIFGSGESDQFAEEEIYEAKKPRRIKINMPYKIAIEEIACGALSTVFLDGRGDVYTFGGCDNYCLGHPIFPNEKDSKIKKLQIPERMEHISMGDYHGIAYNTYKNLLYIWGTFKDSNGVLKYSKIFPEIYDSKFYGGENIIKAQCGQDHVIILTHSNSVYCFGNHEFGQTGAEPENYSHLNLTESQKDQQKFQSFLAPNKLAEKNIRDIFACSNHNFCLVFDSTLKKNVLKAWGCNFSYQLGILEAEHKDIITKPQKVNFPSKNLNIIKAAGGDKNSMALADNGEIYLWGDNLYCQCCRKESTEPFKHPILCEKLSHKDISDLYSKDHLCYAFNRAGNKIYSWGYTDGYGMGNLEYNDDNHMEPIEISKGLVGDEKIYDISIGGNFVGMIVESYRLSPSETKKVEKNN